jgi:hypothetical protein
MARAQDVTPAFELAARLGYGIPVGDVETHQGLGGTVDDPLGETIMGMVPIGIDAGYRFDPRWFGGLYFAYAPGLLGGALQNACNGISCSVFEMRAGAEVHYHLAPGEPSDPWLGGGFGYEWLRIGASVPFCAASYCSRESWASGFELANLQAGFDIRVGSRVHLGPFAAATIAVYSWNDGLPSSNTFGGPAPHEWVILGVRGTVNLAPRKPDEPKVNWGD